MKPRTTYPPEPSTNGADHVHDPEACSECRRKADLFFEGGVRAERMNRMEKADLVDAGHAHPLYQSLMLAVRAADQAFESKGDAGTKTWLDDYFLPELAEHGLTVTRLAEARNGR